MNLEARVKQFIKGINPATYVLLIVSFVVYSPFIIEQLNSADVNVYGYTYHANYAYENDLGRFFIRIFDMWRNSMVSVVLVIPLSILFGCIAVELIRRALGIEKPLTVFLTGAFIMFSPAMANLFSYAYTADSYCFALLLAAVSGYCLVSVCDFKKKTVVIIPIVILTGIYQAYISVVILIVAVWFLKEMLFAPASKKSWNDNKDKILNIVFSYITIVISLVVYLVVFKLLDAIGYLHMDSERGSDNMLGNALSNIGSGIAGAYKGFYEYFFTNIIINNSWFGRRYINLIMLTVLVVLLVMLIIRNQVYRSLIRIIMTVLVLAVLPLIFCLIVLMAPDASIYAETGLLMMPCINWMYIVPLLFADCIFEKGIIMDKKSVNTASYFITVCISTIMAITMIVFVQCFARLIELQQRQLSQLANRMVYSVESMEEYEYGEKLLVMGRPQMGNYPIPDERLDSICRGMISHYSQIFGAEDQIAHGWIPALKYYVGVDFTVCTDEEIESILSSPEYMNMGIYPDESAVKRFGDITVIKLSEGYEHK